ncbi:hypothetical protein ACLMJK_004322 [Lecanora helva]
MVRTRFTQPNIVLFVDRAIIVRDVSSDESSTKGAYRLYLTDGDKSIQAVFKRRMHKQVVSLEIRAGSYISLRDYVLAAGKRLSGDGNVHYLIISDFAWAGEEQQKSQDIEVIEQYHYTAHGEPGTHGPPASRDNNFGDVHVHESEHGAKCLYRDEWLASGFNKIEVYREDLDKNASLVQGQPMGSEDIIEVSEDASNSEHEAKPRTSPHASASPDSQGSPTPGTNGRIGQKRKRMSSPRSAGRSNSLTHPEIEPIPFALAHKASSDATTSAPNSKKAVNFAISPSSCRHTSPHPPSQPKRTQTLQPITRPLKLRDLASLTGPNRSRNKVVDVLALIDSVDPHTTKPAALPLKRDARLVDNSTPRIVTLSIFVNPEKCELKAGDVVLFRNLVTHEYKGGALNAYPAYCEGKEWWMRDPEPELFDDSISKFLRELLPKLKEMQKERRSRIEKESYG